jgi:hypothetical protein
MDISDDVKHIYLIARSPLLTKEESLKEIQRILNLAYEKENTRRQKKERRKET